MLDVICEAPKVGASLEGAKVNQFIQWLEAVNKVLHSLKLDKTNLPRALSHSRARPKICQYRKIHMPLRNWITP